MSHNEHPLVINWFEMGGQFFTFLVFVSIIFYAVKKPLLEFFSNRHLDIKKALNEAKEAKIQAQNKMNEYQEKLKNLDSELASLKETLARSMHNEQERIIEEANILAQKIKNETKNLMQQEILRAQVELKKETTQLAISIATQILKREMTPHDHKKIVEDFTHQVVRMASEKKRQNSQKPPTSDSGVLS